MPTEEEVLKIGKKLEKMIASSTTVSIVMGIRAFCFSYFLSIYIEMAISRRNTLVYESTREVPIYIWKISSIVRPI